MNIYFKLIYHLSYSESENLCTWERERTEEFLLQKSQGQNRLVRVENGGWGDGWPSVPFPYPTTYTLIHGCVKGGWSKSGGPRHPEFMLWAFVCVTMHIRKYANVYMCDCTCCIHAQMCLCVCTCIYIWVPHINTLIPQMSCLSRCNCWIGTVLIILPNGIHDSL